MIGQKLGSFHIDGKLGSGAMGIVYHAVHETTGKTAAVKVLTSELNQKNNAYERFKREAEILQQFRHPNIVRFLALGRYQGTAYFAMEFVKGITLEQLLEQRGFVPWQEAMALGIQMCDALQYAHQHGVVHRDLKPSNLMITEQGHVKLTDFGIAKDLDATALTATGRTLGTAAYMAPEQIRGTPATSHKTDLYALGVVLYQMLAGDVPFNGPTAVVMMNRHLNEEPPRPSAKVAELPLEFDKLVVKLMAKEPADRPWDAAAAGMVLTDLRDKQQRGEPITMVWPTMGADGTSATTVGKKTGKKRKRRRKPDRAWWIQTGSLTTALVVLVALMGYFLWPTSAAYYYNQAEPLMASKEAGNWKIAERDYLDELDRRHPKHPYKAQVEKWRDQIALDRAVRRSGVLGKRHLGALSRHQNDAEEAYVSVADKVEEVMKQSDEQEAAKLWAGLADHLKTLKETDTRGWILLAHQNQTAMDKKVAERKEDIEKLLVKAHDAITNHDKPDKAAAERIWKQVAKEAEKIPYLKPYQVLAEVNMKLAQAHQAFADGKHTDAIKLWKEVVSECEPYPELKELMGQTQTQLDGVLESQAKQAENSPAAPSDKPRQQEKPEDSGKTPGRSG
jgi:eukaryotic-like serine/threonine-protein kinase